MKVIVPHTNSPVLYWVDLALRQSETRAEFVEILHSDGYHKLLAKLWAEQEDFCIVEHDIIVWPGAIQQLEACPEPWCYFPYICNMGPLIENAGLGCTRFRASMMEAYPDLFEGFTPSWRNQDEQIQLVLGDEGISPHRHGPMVTHLADKNFVSPDHWGQTDFSTLSTPDHM